MSFAPSRWVLKITNFQILCGDDDFVDVHIALESLAKDPEQIIRTKRDVRKATVTTADHEYSSGSSIIAGSGNTSIIRHLLEDKIIDLCDFERK